MDDEIRTLSNAIIGEIFLALGFSKTGWAYRTFGGLFRPAAQRLSTISLTADRMVVSDGFPTAAAWILTNWCEGVTAHGTETIPSSGPLLVISNHAGAYDTFVLASKINRNDLNLIASDVPFLKYLPNASHHIYYISDRVQDRMTAARAGIHHLETGGCLLLYGTGLIDPDPAVYTGAEDWIDKWLPSIDLFLKRVPETQVVISIVSGVVADRWAYHPITWLKRVDWQKRRLAEFGQVIQQLFRPGSFYLSPHVSFSRPYQVAELLQAGDNGRCLPTVIAHGKAALTEHQALFLNQEMRPG